MTIGPVQLIVIGFDRPFHGEIIAGPTSSGCMT